MEEIVDKEKDLKQLAQVTNMLYDRNKELQKQHDEQVDQLEAQMFENKNLEEKVSLHAVRILNMMTARLLNGAFLLYRRKQKINCLAYKLQRSIMLILSEISLKQMLKQLITKRIKDVFKKLRANSKKKSCRQKENSKKEIMNYNN